VPWGPPVPVQNAPEPPPARADAQRAIRYNHLIGRLRNRQITMEEATELFGLMQGMLRASEAARLARVAQPDATPVPAPRTPKPAAVGMPMSDDLLLAGILAMGAGAGLLAAITKRMNEGSAPSKGAASPSPPTTRATSR